jgi:hypothetical protein
MTARRPAQLIPVLPHLGELAVLHTEDVDAGDVHSPSRGGDTQQIPRMDTAGAPANRDPVAAGERHRARGAGPRRAVDVSSRRRADQVQQLCQSMEVM